MAQLPLYPHAHGAVLRGVPEDTYNDGQTVNAADTLHCPEAASFHSFQRTFIQRTGASGFLSGFKPSPGRAIGSYKIPVELDHKTLGAVDISDAASLAGVPEAHKWLVGGGFVPSFAEDADYSGVKPDNVTLAGGGNDKVLTYAYRPRSTVDLSSLRLQLTRIAEGAAKGWLHDLKGARHGWTMNFPGGEHAIMDCQGNSLATLPTKVTNPTTNSALADVSRVVGLGVNPSIHKITATSATYGKTSETADGSTLTADVRNFAIQSNLGLTAIQAPSGKYGVSRILFAPKTPTCTFTLDHLTWSDDFDIYAFANGSEGIRVSWAIPSPDDDVSFIVITLTGFIISDMMDGIENGYVNMPVTLQLGYPGAAPGTVPSELLKIQYVTIVGA